MMELFRFIWHYVKENYFYILLLLISFLSYLKTGKIYLGDKEKMLYKTEKDLYNKSKTGQDFTNCHLVKTYRLNASGDLEATGELVDMDELIQSSRDTCLTAVLEKFSNLADSCKVDNETVSTYNGMQDDLIELGDLLDKAEGFREKYGLDMSMSTKEVFDYVNTQSKELNAKIKAEQDKMTALKNILKKGEKENETSQNVEKSK